MPDLRLIGPLIRSTPAGIKRALGQSRALPNDLLREASRRLGITALLVAVLWTVATIADHLAIRMQTHGSPRWLELGPDEAFAAIGISASLALYAFSRRTDRDPAFVLDLGLVYLVVIGFTIGLMIHWHPVPSSWPVSPVISWVGAVRADVRGDRAEHAGEDVRRRLRRRVHESPVDAHREGTGHLGLRRPGECAAHALSRLPAGRRGGRDRVRRAKPRAAGGAGAGDGQLSARRADRARRHGRGLPRHAIACWRARPRSS